MKLTNKAVDFIHFILSRIKNTVNLQIVALLLIVHVINCPLLVVAPLPQLDHKCEKMILYETIYRCEMHYTIIALVKPIVFRDPNGTIH